MDTVSTIENSQNTQGTKIRTLLILTIGVIVGLLIGAGVAFYFFRDAIFFMTPSTANTSTLSYPNPSAQQIPDLNTKINILLPKKLVGEEYYLLINKIANETKQVGVNNVSTIIPIMESIKQKSISRDFNGLFDLVTQAKNEIKNNVALLATTHEDIAAMRKVNAETVKDADIRKQTDTLLDASDVFVQAFTDYFAILNETLSGSIPTQSLLDKLSAQVTVLGKAGTSVQTELNSLLTIIKQKNDATIR